MKQVFTFLLLLVFAYTANGQKRIESFDVPLDLSDYRIVNFKSNDSTWVTQSQDTLNVYEGEAALSLEYSIRSFEAYSGTTLAMHIPSEEDYFDFSGYEKISFNIYNKVQSSQTGRAALRLTLYDKSDFGIDGVDNRREFWISYLGTLDMEPGWNTITVPLKDVGETALSDPGSGFWHSTVVGHPGNEMLDLDKISGLGFAIEDLGPDDSTDITGTFLVDNVMAIGEQPSPLGEEPIEAFDVPFEETGYQLTHFSTSNNSSVNRSQETMDVYEGDASLRLEYGIKREETWGGTAGVTAFEKSDEYWDFSGYDSISFNVYTKGKSSTAGLSHLRFNLYDRSEPGQTECWYSFHWPLDLEPGWNAITLPLKDAGATAQSEPGSGFWLTGWIFQMGNESLDLDKIVGFGFEIAVAGPADLDTVTGTLLIDNLHLVSEKTVTAVSTLENIPNTFSLEQNYPNPFHNGTILKFTLARQEKVTLSVFDITGKEVNVLVNETLSSGEYTVPFYAENLPDGVYYYQLQAGEFASTRKMIVLR